MICSFTARPFPNARARAGHLQLVGLGLLAFAVLCVWNPVTHPGPKICLCLMRRAVGLPCPLCGMTRGVALCLRGRFAEATQFNPLAMPCVLLGLALLAKWSYEYARGVRLEVVWHRRAARLAFLSLCSLILLANWAYLLSYRREDDFATSAAGRLLRAFWP
jgi:hypothetical protein